MRRRWSIGFPYAVAAVITVLVLFDTFGRSGAVDTTSETGAAMQMASAEPGTLRDPVCNMDVHAGWGFSATHDGTPYHFCSTRCVELFTADPDAYLQERCVVCDAPLAGMTPWRATYQDRVYTTCSAEHRVAFLADPAGYFLHQMWGIPGWMYYVSIAGVLAVSFVGFEWRGRRRERARAPSRALAAASGNGNGHVVAPEPVAAAVMAGGEAGGVATPTLPLVITAPPAYDESDPPDSGEPPPAYDESDPPGSDEPPPRVDLLRVVPGLARLLRWPPTRFIAQSGVASLFLLVIVAGLWGNQNPALNIAPILTWTVWWGGLVLLIMFAGKAWCYVCPWDALAGWMERGKLWGTGEGMSLGLRWPRALRNIWPATVLFIGLTWLELGWGVTMRPRVTAYLALGMFALAFVCALLFDRKTFCRYGCLIGRISGLYALFSGLELRARDRQVCKGCHTKDCYRGNERGDGCPTFEFMGAMDLNTYCTLCGECLKTCPEDNIALNLRPWGTDLVKRGRPRADEAYLALLMLAITAFHGLTMTPRWTELTERLAAAMGVSAAVAFTLGMVAIMVAPILIYAGLVRISYHLSSDGMLSYRGYFIRYAYALLPIALFYHLAHNAEHLLMEGPKAIRLLSDPLGLGWDLIGTASAAVPPLISLGTLWYVQVALVLVGHVYSLWVADHTARHLFSSRRAAFRSQLPMLAGMVLFSVFSLWLLKQPMIMRTSAM